MIPLGHDFGPCKALALILAMVLGLGLQHAKSAELHAAAATETALLLFC